MKRRHRRHHCKVFTGVVSPTLPPGALAWRLQRSANPREKKPRSWAPWPLPPPPPPKVEGKEDAPGLHFCAEKQAFQRVA